MLYFIGHDGLLLQERRAPTRSSLPLPRVALRLSASAEMPHSVYPPRGTSGRCPSCGRRRRRRACFLSCRRSRRCRRCRRPVSVSLWSFRFVLSSSFSFFVVEQIPEGMSPRRYAPGRGVNRKIGGNLQGEPILPVDAGSARAWQGSDAPRGMCKHEVLGGEMTTPETTRTQSPAMARRSVVAIE